MTSGNKTDKTQNREMEGEALSATVPESASGLLAQIRDIARNDTIQTVFFALAIAIVVRIVAFEPFNIPSGSMRPTLLEGDYLFVSKYSYGYSKHSIPWRLIPFDGRVWQGEVERGDVVVFRVPFDRNGNSMNAQRVKQSGKTPPGGYTDYIKRLVGLPGDRIQVIAGVLHINGEAVERRPVEDYIDEYGRRIPQYEETLPNGVKHLILESNGDNGFSDNTTEFVVPEGYYFAMGDNRDNSADSRATIGVIPAENLIGRAEVLFFSTDGSAALWEIWKWPFAIRYSRLFNSVD